MPNAPRYRDAQFLKSAGRLNQCPPDQGWEVAFAGRSNAGKSSAINTLTGNRKLARTSKTPGRTQLINFFTLSDEQRLVDLPGYGYAKVPEAVKREWTRQLEHYLQERRSLRGLILLMDARRPLQEFDRITLRASVSRVGSMRDRKPGRRASRSGRSTSLHSVPTRAPTSRPKRSAASSVTAVLIAARSLRLGG